MALLPKPLPQILFKAGASVMGLGIGGKRRGVFVPASGWEGVDMLVPVHACICVCV